MCAYLCTLAGQLWSKVKSLRQKKYLYDLRCVCVWVSGHKSLVGLIIPNVTQQTVQKTLYMQVTEPDIKKKKNRQLSDVHADHRTN